MAACVLTKKEKIIDGEFLFRYYWLDMGEARSVGKLVKLLTGQNKVNPKTGRKFTVMAAWFAMWLWAKNNPDKAYPIMQKAAYDQGDYYSQEDFDKELQDKVWTLYKKNPLRFNKWLKRHGKEKMINV